MAASTTASANAGGVKSPGGVLTQSRAPATASATTWASSTTVCISARRAPGESRTTSPGCAFLSSSFAFLYVVYV